jgi:hypothetical protein
MSAECLTAGPVPRAYDSLNTPRGLVWPASRRKALDRLLRKWAKARRLPPSSFESELHHAFVEPPLSARSEAAGGEGRVGVGVRRPFISEGPTIGGSVRPAVPKIRPGEPSGDWLAEFAVCIAVSRPHAGTLIILPNAGEPASLVKLIHRIQ